MSESRDAPIRRTVSTHDSQADAYVVLRRWQANEPRAKFDLIDVRHADPPIRSINRWAVVRYVD
jgi:hypothetical protein